MSSHSVLPEPSCPPPRRDASKLAAEASAGGGAVKLVVNGRAVSVRLGEHFFLSAGARAAAAK